jgi:hypothetical protein
MPWPWGERLRPLRMGSIAQMPVSNSQLTSVSAGQGRAVARQGLDL